MKDKGERSTTELHGGNTELHGGVEGFSDYFTQRHEDAKAQREYKGEENMSARSIFFISVFFTVTAVLFGQDLEYVTIRRTMLYSNPAANPVSSGQPLFEIDADIRVKHIERPSVFTKLTNNNGVVVILGTFEYNNIKYYINCADLVPANTVDTVAPLLISDLNSSDRRTWVPSYYAGVLQSLDRDTVLLLDSYWREKYDPYRYGNPGDNYREEWNERFLVLFPCNEFLIFNFVLTYNNDIFMVIKNIKKMYNGYIATVKFSEVDWEQYKHDNLNWDHVKGKEFFDMILCVDGDYMDVYLDDMEHKLTSFVLVDQVFLNELKALIKDNNADLSRISSWPKRADGSIDYPLPSNTKEDKQPELTDLYVDTENQRVAQSSAKTSAIPLWAWFAITGGAVVIAGGVVFAVRRRK